jgi:hypothetical protein
MPERLQEPYSSVLRQPGKQNKTEIVESSYKYLVTQDGKNTLHSDNNF